MEIFKTSNIYDVMFEALHRHKTMPHQFEQKHLIEQSVKNSKERKEEFIKVLESKKDPLAIEEKQIDKTFKGKTDEFLKMLVSIKEVNPSENHPKSQDIDYNDNE